MLVKNNSISLLEFVFDLNFDEIIFLENPIKIIQNKDKDFLEFNSIMDSLKFYHNTYNIKWQFIKKYSGRVYERTIHFKITFKKRKEKES